MLQAEFAAVFGTVDQVKQFFTQERVHQQLGQHVLQRFGTLLQGPAEQDVDGIE